MLFRAVCLTVASRSAARTLLLARCAKRYGISAIINVPIRSGATRALMLAVSWWLQECAGRGVKAMAMKITRRSESWH